MRNPYVQITGDACCPSPPLFTVPSIDIFITYRCGLRCSHCFVGENLYTSRDMTLATLQDLLRAARSWSTTLITFLGGEPTMHPQFLDAVHMALAEGFQVRIATNGHTSYARFLHAGKGTRPFICFSLDGSTPAVHDAIRGSGAFRILLENINRTQARGFRTGAIVAVCRENVKDTKGIIRLYDRLGFEYANIHYVTSRGFATRAATLSVDEGKETYRQTESIAPDLRIELRVEKTFYESTLGPLQCAVEEQGNLMFLPDGRVYMCMMFIDVANSESFSWVEGRGFSRNGSVTSEQLLASPRRLGCPALALVNPEVAAEAERQGTFVQ